MDNFMDKLAQRLTAQEMIKANLAADAAELERLQSQLAEYDACLQEMRKLSLKNAENTDKIGTLVDAGIQKIRACDAKQADLFPIIESLQELQRLVVEKQADAEWEQELFDELDDNNEEIKKILKDNLDLTKASLQEMFDKSDEFMHKESVKVYRNVQAVVTEENQKMSEAFTAGQKKIEGKSSRTFIFSIVTMAVVVVDIVLNLLMHFKVF